MGRGSVNTLFVSGLTNRDTLDYGTFASSKRAEVTYKYYCTSDRCTSKKNAKGKDIRVEKAYKATTSKWLTNCEDCGYVLTSKRCLE